MSDSPAIHWDHDEEGVVVLTIDDPGEAENTLNDVFIRSLAVTVDRLEASVDDVAGVVLRSAKPSFFVCGNLTALLEATRADAPTLATGIQEIKSLLRRLETLGPPVVAAIHGGALGNGLEIALAAHHRVVVDDPGVQLAFRQVRLDLLPGVGGVVRSVRMLGVVDALTRLLLEGNRVRPQEGLELGLVDEVVSAQEELVPAAKRWISAHGRARQPWDEPGYRLPGGTPTDPELARVLATLPAKLRARTNGAPYSAGRHMLAAAVEGAQVDIENAFEIETRYFVDLAVGPVSKNMIQGFFDLRKVTGDGDSRRAGGRFVPAKVAVVGAGMMGAGIAYACARAGIDVVLQDVDLERAERGKDYSSRLVERAVERNRTTRAEADALLTRIEPAADPAAARGADLAIEAVFEEPDVKARVLKEIEAHVSDDALIASNTSTLPIAELVEGLSRPADFVGLHFFSPVDKMPLVEVVRGEQTSDRTIERALDFVKHIKRTPIVVNDGRGFFTSRVIGAFQKEGVAMLLEGIPAATIEHASLLAGYPTPVLRLCDEVSIELLVNVRDAARGAAVARGEVPQEHPAFAVHDRMLAAGRRGRAGGAGFYDYDGGTRLGLWSGLNALFPVAGDPAAINLTDLVERMLFIESIEAVKCVDEDVISSVADANIASIMGIGFPAWTGGVLQYIDGHEAGVAGFVARAQTLAERYGERFRPPTSLVDKAERGERYRDDAGVAGHGRRSEQGLVVG